LITQATGVTLLLRFADCVPILLYDSHQQAVGLVHAGWRGTMGSIAARAVEAMVTEFDSDPTDIAAVVGPSIGPCCYEVGDEVIAAAHRTFGQDTPLLSDVPAEAQTTLSSTARSAHTDIPPAKRSQTHKQHFDLWAANQQLLRAAGVARIEVARICTACHNDNFFSYRAGRARTGAHGALICLNH
jgi:YfiH family protein